MTKEEITALACKHEAYDLIDRFLCNSLHDDDYAEYSAALESVRLGAAQPVQPAGECPNLVNYKGELLKLIEQIGIARFVGRINSGVIQDKEGYDTVEVFVKNASRQHAISLGCSPRQ